MRANLYFNIIIFTLAAVVIYIFWTVKEKATNRNYKFRESGYKNLQKLVRFKGDSQEYDNLFNRAGLRVKVQQYQLVRYFIFILWGFLLLAANRFRLSAFPNMQLFFWVALFLISSPKKALFNKKTPFMVIMEMLTKEHRYKINVEIYRVLSQLKNMALFHSDKPLGALFIFQQINKFTKVTRPIFNRLIYLYQSNRKEDAIAFFENEIGTKEASELVNVLMKLDYLTPAELKSQLELYQQHVKTERATQRKKSNENKSNLVYLMVVLSLFIIVLNFIIIVAYLDSFNYLKFQF